jgi:hypothetical protein
MLLPLMSLTVQCMLLAAACPPRCHLFELEAGVSSSQEGSSDEGEGEGADTDLSGFIAASGATTPATGCTDR